MTATDVQTLAHELGGEAVGFATGATVRAFALDSKSASSGDLFLAIKGARVNGHDFVPQALAQGAVGAVVERPVDGPHILVPNLVDALARLASSRRAAFVGPVVGITGSVGKTTTKEFAAAALSPLGPVLKTEGNRNTEYTAPLLWLDLLPEHRAAVVEMGMRGPGQIAHLASFSRPTVGLITNIGQAHLEVVGSQEGIARAKGELLEALPSGGVAVLPAEDAFLTVLRERARGGRVRTFGVSEGADCRITRYVPLGWGAAAIEGTLDGVRWEATLPAVGRHIALSAAAGLLAACSVGVGVDEGAAALATTQLPPMRMEVRRIGGATVVVDTYNASPPSVLAALEVLAELPVEGRRLAVIGEMRELGAASEEGHRVVGRALAEYRLDGVLFVGEATAYAREEAMRAGLDASVVTTAASLEDVTRFVHAAGPGDAVLVKGSRALELERALEEPTFA